MDKRNTLTISIGHLLVGGMLLSASVAQAASGSAHQRLSTLMQMPLLFSCKRGEL